MDLLTIIIIVIILDKRRDRVKGAWQAQREVHAGKFRKDHPDWSTRQVNRAAHWANRAWWGAEARRFFPTYRAAWAEGFAEVRLAHALQREKNQRSHGTYRAALDDLTLKRRLYNREAATGKTTLPFAKWYSARSGSARLGTKTDQAKHHQWVRRRRGIPRGRYAAVCSCGMETALHSSESAMLDELNGHQNTGPQKASAAGPQTGPRKPPATGPQGGPRTPAATGPQTVPATGPQTSPRVVPANSPGSPNSGTSNNGNASHAPTANYTDKSRNQQSHAPDQNKTRIDQLTDLIEARELAGDDRDKFAEKRGMWERQAAAAVAAGDHDTAHSAAAAAGVMTQHEKEADQRRQNAIAAITQLNPTGKELNDARQLWEDRQARTAHHTVIPDPRMAVIGKTIQAPATAQSTARTVSAQPLSTDATTASPPSASGPRVVSAGNNNEGAPMSDILPSGDLTGGDSKYEAAVHATGRLEEFFRDLTTQLGTFEAELTVVEFDRDPQVMAAVRSLQELGRQSIAAVASLRDAFAQHRQASEYHKQGNDAKAEAFR